MKIYFDDGAPTPAFTYLQGRSPLPSEPEGTTPARRQRRGLRNWQKFVLCYSLIMAGGVLTAPVWGSTWRDGGPWLLFAAIGLLVWLMTTMVILTAAWRKGRL